MNELHTSSILAHTTISFRFKGEKGCSEKRNFKPTTEGREGSGIKPVFHCIVPKGFMKKITTDITLL